MTLVDVINLFDNEDKCRELLVRLRGPHGVECTRCNLTAVELETAKQLFYSKGCAYQFSVTSMKQGKYNPTLSRDVARRPDDE